MYESDIRDTKPATSLKRIISAFVTLRGHSRSLILVPIETHIRLPISD